MANPTISLSEASAGASAVQYTVGFKASSALATGAVVALTAPAGTSFAGATVTVVDITHAGGSANVASSSVKASAVAPSASANQLSISLPKAIGAGDSVLVEVQGAANPPAGTYGGSAGNFTVSTSSDVVPVLVPSYVVSAGPGPGPGQHRAQFHGPGGNGPVQRGRPQDAGFPGGRELHGRAEGAGGDGLPRQCR